MLVENNTVIQNSTSGISRGILIDTPDSGTSPSFYSQSSWKQCKCNDNVAGVNGIAVQAVRAQPPVVTSVIQLPIPIIPVWCFGLRLRQANTGNVHLEQGISVGTLHCNRGQQPSFNNRNH